MATQQETFYAIALHHAGYFCPTPMAGLYRRLGSATAMMEHRRDIKEMFPKAPLSLIEALNDIDDDMAYAEKEMEFNEKHSVRPILLNDADYPQRLRQCEDAPMMLFYRGTADLNEAHVVSIVGTRRATNYSRDVLKRFVAELRQLCPDTIIVSGLAYGVDVIAHREALDNGLDTVGVLAHGLDTLYPAAHRDITTQMISHGALLTEYLTHTKADKANFVRRNRIVAGMCDACILVESAAKGGGLITMEKASDYNRELFAVPGSILTGVSDGCNDLLRNNLASMLVSAEDFVDKMGWNEHHRLFEARQAGIERQIFPELTDNEQRIANELKVNGDEQLNIIAARLAMPVHVASAALFTMEMKGVVRMMAGNIYHLIQ
jgi:DNA processing protein